MNHNHTCPRRAVPDRDEGAVLDNLLRGGAGSGDPGARPDTAGAARLEPVMAAPGTEYLG